MEWYILSFCFGIIFGYVIKRDPRNKDGQFIKKKWWQK